jgi:peptidoglycan/xylan/chitin deacetylase (PgdA/CDA1 family)
MSTPISVDGQLFDWTALDRIDFGAVAVPGYELFGRMEGDQFYLGLKTNGLPIGLGTTAWLNTDANTALGYQIFGQYLGAEYKIEFVADPVFGAKPVLYSVAPDGTATVVNANLTFAYSADKTAVEISVPKTSISNTSAVTAVFDVNDQVFLPTTYASGAYEISDLPAATDSSLKIGIVFSETSAKKYFSETAYAQLIMAVQAQAAAAGIPFDILTENDLTQLNTVIKYDALIFPSFGYVPSEKVSTIQDVLTTAVYHYGISLVAAGNFMTNDADGVALPNDSYERMKLLLGVERTGGGSSNVVSVTATGDQSVTGYADGEVVHTYTATGTSQIGTAYFNGVSAGSTQVVATQTTSDGTNAAVLTTQTGGNNVFFATESFLADSNMLQNALQWSVQSAAAPELMLHMSRYSSLFASRTDMDQSQEQIDVNGGIYDKLLPLVEQWKTDYNFVGSYYINVGSGPGAEQATDWSKSKPYYQQLLALGNEIGSHSYTHPENTNTLTAEQIKFEFEASKAIIEQQLGIQVLGAAVPGAPESTQTAKAILQYYSYVTGGYSGIGAGYPNAFGFLQPGDTSKVYIAPNLKFDFSLVEAAPEFGGGLTAEQAKQEWIREFDELSRNSDLPVIVWPWHDYGPTQWMVDPPTPSPYTPSMYTDFIAYAYSKGSEFVTLAELADRIRAFEQAEFNYTFDSMTATITATVTSTNVGDFALDLGDAQTIASVSGWFAYDEDSVFLGANGGTYTIKLGSPQDVTHITSLPMRAELQSTEGDGRNLKFSVIGEGTVVIDLANPAGDLAAVTGAQVVSQVGDRLELKLVGTGLHHVTVALPPAAAGTLASVALLNDTGPSAADFVTSDGRVVLSGTAQAGAAVAIFDNGVKVADAVVTGNAWTWSGELGEGTHQITAAFTDVDGNVKTAAAPKPVVVDHTPPALALADRQLVNDTGISGADRISKDGRLQLSGSVEAGTQVRILDGGVQIGTATVGAGAWTWSGKLAGTGLHELSVQAVDLAGNLTSVAAGKVAIDLATAPSGDIFAAIDTLAPIAPTVDAGRTVPLKTGAFAIKGQAEAHSLVKVYDGGNLLGTTTASSSGAWSLTTKKLFGKHSFWATDEDVAGNVSGKSGAFIYGTASSEKLTSTAGSDVFRGRGGSDVFAFKDAIGQDVIRDFAAEGRGHDVLQFDIGLFSGFSSVLRAAKNVGNDVVIKAANGQSLTLKNVAKSELDAVDFRFTGKSVVGSDGRNTLTSTDANEIFTGKGGADSFVFKANFGKDVIRDFDEGAHRGHDYVRFSKALFSSFDSVMSAARQVGTDVVITTSAGDSLALWNVRKADLVADDFRFF